MWKSTGTAVLAAAICLVAASSLFWYVRRHGTPGWQKYRAQSSSAGAREAEISSAFARPDKFSSIFDLLFEYFLDGFLDHAAADFAYINYPGVPSVRGYKINGLEGFARTAPVFAAWIHSRRPSIVKSRKSGYVDLVDVLRRGILAGTDSNSKSYWGDIKDDDQRIVEAADIARVIWLTKREIWDCWGANERSRVVRWLEGAKTARIRQRNNWILFPVIVDSVLCALSGHGRTNMANYEELKSYYLERGWFYDLPEGVDYYNAWGITYDLFWLHLLNPEFENEHIRSLIAQSSDLTAHLISPQGVPILGRSIYYRTAIPCPVIAESIVSNSANKKAIAKRALYLIWRYFIQNSCLRDGTLTQGYFDNDPRFVEVYSGAGSAHWGLRSLVLAYMTSADDSFWVGRDTPLPVEIGSYTIVLPKLGWTIIGDSATLSVKIKLTNNCLASVLPTSYTVWTKIAEAVLHRPFRPRNHDIKYSLSEYSSANPFPCTERVVT